MDRLKDMIIKNSEEKMDLMERRAQVGDEDDYDGDDPEMIDKKMSASESLICFSLVRRLES